MIPKRGKDTILPQNYRLISLLFDLFKVVEALILDLLHVKLLRNLQPLQVKHDFRDGQNRRKFERYTTYHILHKSRVPSCVGGGGYHIFVSRYYCGGNPGLIVGTIPLFNTHIRYLRRGGANHDVWLPHPEEVFYTQVDKLVEEAVDCSSRLRLRMNKSMCRHQVQPHDDIFASGALLSIRTRC